MVRISEDMLRKRAEHNNLEIATLEEVSLHQQDIERIEFIDKWCRELKILYLQSNLIPKIENVARLKKLEYINLALNNIERVENLEACESLKKLDLTVNFVGELTSIESLKYLEHFEELYLTGNPCADYEGYRNYVIATLPHLKQLDGTEIDKSERIKALQEYDTVREKILSQQEDYRRKREEQKAEHATRVAQTGTVSHESREEAVKKFTEEEVPYTPESRIEMHEQMKELKKREQETPGPTKPPRRLFADDGRALNINDPKLDFKITEDDEANAVVLELGVWKHLDTSFLNIDVQPTYVRVEVKQKLVQLALPDEVRPDFSKAERSQITGALVVTMPKLHGEPRKKETPTKPPTANNGAAPQSNNFLELSEPAQKVDYRNIIAKEGAESKGTVRSSGSKAAIQPPPQAVPHSVVSTADDDEEFIDDPNVPPLI